MKFNNAYSLILHLYENGLLKGIDLGLRGEYTVDTTVKDPKLLKILNELFGEWRWSSGGELEEGYYELVRGENGELAFGISISTDILDFWGNPFEIEDILRIIVEELELTKVDMDEYLENQFILDLEIDYPNTNKPTFEIQKFEIYSDTKGDEIDIEIKTKLLENDLNRLKQMIADYLVNVHKQNHKFDFSGFQLIIDRRNSIGPYYGTGHEYFEGIKKVFKEKVIEFEMK